MALVQNDPFCVKNTGRPLDFVAPVKLGNEWLALRLIFGVCVSLHLYYFN